MPTLYQLLREFILPLVFALIWTMYNLAAAPKWTVLHAVNVFGPTFFFVSWLVAQWFRVRKQQKVEANLREIDASLKNTVEKIDQKTSDLINYITGGDSFCYLCGSAESEVELLSPLLLTHVGKYPLYDVKLRMVDIDVPVVQPKAYLMEAREWRRAFGDLIPSHGKALKEEINLGKGQSRRFNLFFSARNGSFHQLLRFKKIEGVWRHALQVWRANQLVFEEISDKYPRDKEGKVNWEL